MRSNLVLGGLVLALCGVPMIASGQGKDEKFELDKLAGTWSYVKGEKAGLKLDADHFKGQSVVFAKDTMMLKGEANFTIKYEIDAAKKPAVIKMTITESPFGAGMMSIGIISVSGDSLKICYDPENKAAPKAFESKEGSSAHYFELKRAK